MGDAEAARKDWLKPLQKMSIEFDRLMYIIHEEKPRWVVFFEAIAFP